MFRGKGKEGTERKAGPGVLRVACHHSWTRGSGEEAGKGQKLKPGAPRCPDKESRRPSWSHIFSGMETSKIFEQDAVL